MNETAQKANIARINSLFANLREIQARPDIGLVKAIRLCREIGLLLTLLIGRAWTLAKFQRLDGLQIDFARAKHCLRIYLQLPGQFTADDAARMSADVLEVMRTIEAKKQKIRPKHAISPAVTIYNSFETTRATVSKKLARSEDWDADTWESVNRIINEQLKWLNGLAKAKAT